MAEKNYSIEELKDIIAPIAKKYGVQRVYLFGSYARGNNNSQSDIDLRIDKGSLQGMFALCALYTELAETLRTEVDVLTTESLEDEFLERIKNDEVLLYAG